MARKMPALFVCPPTGLQPRHGLPSPFSLQSGAQEGSASQRLWALAPFPHNPQPRHNVGMRLFSGILLSLLFVSSVAVAAVEEKLGAPLTIKDQTPIADLMRKPVRFVGRTVQVKGKVTEVCQKMGCWIMLTDPATGAAVRIKVKDGEIVFPKESVGKIAIAEGTFTETRLTREQALERARHQAEEQGVKFDPSTVKGPVTSYQVQGSGAIIQE
jgi:hypothetical protein